MKPRELRDLENGLPCYNFHIIQLTTGCFVLLLLLSGNGNNDY